MKFKVITQEKLLTWLWTAASDEQVLRVGTATHRELLHKHSPWCCDPQALLQVPQISTFTWNLPHTQTESWDPKATMLTWLTQPAPLEISFASLSLLQHVLLEQSCSEMERHHCHSQGDCGWWLPTGSHWDASYSSFGELHPPVWRLLHL